jgi:hypothetical protein
MNLEIKQDRKTILLVKSKLVCKFTRLKKLHQSVYAAKAVDDEYMAC